MPVMKIYPGIVDSGSDESETGEASPITKSMSQVNYEDIMPGLRGCETQNVAKTLQQSLLPLDMANQGPTPLR